MNAIGYVVGVATFVAVVLVLGYRFFKYVYIKLKTSRIDCENVTGKVIKKEHVHSHAGSGESHLVWVKYNGIEQCIDNKDIYSRYRVGNQIKLILFKKFDINNKLLEQTLEPRH